MIRGAVVKAIDNASSTTTSGVIDVRNYDGVFILSHDEGSFSGTISVLADLAEADRYGAEQATGNYKQYGASLTLDRVERLDDTPAKIKISVTRTAGAVSVWVQPFIRGRM